MPDVTEDTHMNGTLKLAKDKLGKCRYVVTLTGTTLKVVMDGYGFRGQATVETTTKRKRKPHFNDYAHLLTGQMVTLERRLGELARLTNALKANKVTGVARSVASSVRRPARGVNPLDSIRV